MNSPEGQTRHRSSAAAPPTIGVFVCSSDSRKDILERVLPSLLKYWPDCPYPIYVGLNAISDISPKVTTLVAQRSEWRTETLEQVAQMTESHLIVVLDDFLFCGPVNQSRLSILISEVVASNLSYLRLLPLRKSIFERSFNFGRVAPAVDIHAINKRRPFYSSLQIAIWNKAHFLSLLRLRGSVWEFEHQKATGTVHYCITARPPISYIHLVEKGRWLPYARSLLRQAGLPTDIGTRPSWRRWAHLRRLVDEVRFHILGYANH